MRRRVGVIAFLGVFGCRGPTGPERELDGQRLYNQHCARCHGVDGAPTSQSPQARDLSDIQVVGLLRDDHMKRTIRMGRPPNMPAFGGRFTDAALDVLVAHVRSLSGSRGQHAKREP